MTNQSLRGPRPETDQLPSGPHSDQQRATGFLTWAVSTGAAALVEGLLLCACTHHGIHPDMLDCAEGISSMPGCQDGKVSY